MNLGMGMAGLEDQVETVVRGVRDQFNQMTYLEIGIADGGTLAPVSKLISAKPWRSIGVDCNMYGGYHPEQVEQNCLGQHLSIGFIKPNGWNHIDPSWNRVSVVFADSRDFFEGMWNEPIQLCLIDGCHKKEFAMQDFTNVERYIVPGGTVLIHDLEPYKDDHYDVMQACVELGILDGKREGWTQPRILAADHSKGGSGFNGKDQGGDHRR